MRRSLQRKYAIAFAGIVGALLVAGGLVGGGLAYLEARAAIETAQQVQARHAAAEAGAFIGRAQAALHAAAAKFDAAGDADAVDSEALRIELASLMRHYPEISALRWIGADGGDGPVLRRFGLGREAEPASPPAPGEVWYAKGSEPHVTLVAEGLSGGALLAETNLKALRERVATPAPGAVTYIVDRHGSLIAHSDLGRMLARTDLSTLPQWRPAIDGAAQGWVGTGRDLAGAAVIAAAAPVPGTRWTVIADQPLAQALQPVWRSMTRWLALVVVGLGAAAGASALLARRMVRPIQAIEQGARRLGEGHYDERIDVHTGDELEALAGQFNRMAERLQQTHAEQERRIAERTQELARANEAKTRFLAAASHDLRQPLLALSLSAGQLRTATLPAPEAALARGVHRAVQSLHALVESLLDLSQLDAGGVRAVPAPVPLEAVLERLRLNGAPLAAAKGLRLRVRPTALWVMTDAMLLERIGMNLLGNALRYTARGGVLVGARRRGDTLRLCVVDTGPGIDPALQPRIFDEFVRAAPPGSEHGLGLGLAIVQRLAALLQHPVTLRSVPGRGTVFELGLPVAPVPMGPPPAVQASLPADRLPGRRVLVVDDEPEVRVALRGQIAAWGCEVAVAADTAEAVARATDRRPELLLCDLNLAGGRSGLDLVLELRGLCGPGLRCAILSAEPSPERLAAVQDAGLPLLAKPASPARLRALLEHLSQ